MLQRINISSLQYIRPGSITAMILVFGALVVSSCSSGKHVPTAKAAGIPTYADSNTSEPVKFSEKKLKKPLFDTAAVYPDQTR